MGHQIPAVTAYEVEELLDLARPRCPRSRSPYRKPLRETEADGPPAGENKKYVAWLRRRSMLRFAQESVREYSGTPVMWRNPYSRPRPRHAIRQASVWFTAYPYALINSPGDSYLKTLGDDALWTAFAAIGIGAIHTGPVKQAGGIDGWLRTPSVDGHFDRIGNGIDAAFGTEAEFKELVDTAARHGGTIIDDIVPGHTGKGADFRLAEMKVGEYPGIYHMVEIPPGEWHLLPAVPEGCDSVNLTPDEEELLSKEGHIVGRLQRVIFYEPGVKETNWSVTRPVKGPDGTTRRWVYLHYFKDGQPSINWLDPSCAGMRLVLGDALHSLGDLGSGGLRLDANGFLAVEKAGQDRPAWSEGHPLSGTVNQLIGSLVRKMGGFTFQELNLTIDDIKAMSEAGADLSYDFITRPAYHHALLTADTEFLRLMLNESLRHGVDPASLVHALQNHDELTYELVHFWTLHRDDTYPFRGSGITGERLRDTIRAELAEALTGADRSYNALFSANGIACTTITTVAAALGYADLTVLSTDDVARIQQAHLLLAMYNAWQPGVLAVSGWDLCGAVTLDQEQVAPLLADGDTRWINRGAHDLMGVAPRAVRSAAGLPRARSLYGSLPEQLGSPDSFASRLREIIAIRNACGIATATQLAVPDPGCPSALLMLHQLPDGSHQVTALNFGPAPVSASVPADALPPGAPVTDMVTGEYVATTASGGSFPVRLDAHQGRSLSVSPTSQPRPASRVG
jgi:trehalose synthase